MKWETLKCLSQAVVSQVGSALLNCNGQVTNTAGKQNSGRAWSLHRSAAAAFRKGTEEEKLLADGSASFQHPGHSASLQHPRQEQDHLTEEEELGAQEIP